MTLRTVFGREFLIACTLSFIPCAAWAEPTTIVPILHPSPQESFLQIDSAAENNDRIVLAELEPLSAEEMQDLRGGFMDPTGLIYNFAINVRTALDGAEIFSRYITVSPSITGGQLQATTGTSLLTQNVPGNLGASIVNGGSGLTVTDASGNHSLILNQTASGVPVSAIFNTMNNSQITQSVDVSLTLSNLASSIEIARTVRAALDQNTALRSLGLH